MRDATETAWQDGALAVAAGEQIVGVIKADIRGSVRRGGAPIGRPVNIPPLLDFRSVGGCESREGKRVELGHALLDFHFQNVFAEFQEAGDDLLWVGKLSDAGFPSVRDVCPIN